jgi:histone acetyltransferase MYST1
LCLRRKRILADEHDSDSDHGDFDVNALREHEEFTKVGVEGVLLGSGQGCVIK